MSDSLISAIKSRLNLRQAARLCSVTLPERDGVKFRSPFRVDRSPSCSIVRDKLIDWTTGASLDAIALFAEARGVSNKQAIRTLSEHLGLFIPGDTGRAELRTRGGTTEEMDMLAKLRHFSVAGQVLAVKCGILSFGEYHGHRAWFVGDRESGPIQARRLDGERWPWGERPKAMTLKGKRITHLVGLPLIGTYPNILVCEGGPDLLAAFCLIHQLDLADWCPLGLLGSCVRIPEHEARLLAGRNIRICAHPDSAGLDAARNWARQLGGQAEIITELEGDLNDLLINQKGEIIFK